DTVGGGEGEGHLVVGVVDDRDVVLVGLAGVELGAERDPVVRAVGGRRRDAPGDAVRGTGGGRHGGSRQQQAERERCRRDNRASHCTCPFVDPDERGRCC